MESFLTIVPLLLRTQSFRSYFKFVLLAREFFLSFLTSSFSSGFKISIQFCGSSTQKTTMDDKRQRKEGDIPFFFFFLGLGNYFTVFFPKYFDLSDSDHIISHLSRPEILN